jgi:cell division protein FtsN
MEGGAPFRPSLRQILWIGAGVVMLTVIVLAGSWLFSPRSPEGSRSSESAGLQEQEVQKQTFQPEASTPAVLPAGAEAASPTGEAEQSPAHPAESPAPAEVEAPHAKPLAAPESPQQSDEAPAPAREALGAFGVQVGAFSSRENASIVQRQLEAKGFRPSILMKGGKYKVVVPGFADRPSAEKGLAALHHAGFPRAFIVPMEP